MYKRVAETQLKRKIWVSVRQRNASKRDVFADLHHNFHTTPYKFAFPPWPCMTICGNNTIHYDETRGIIPNPKGVSHVHAKFIHYNDNVNVVSTKSKIKDVGWRRKSSTFKSSPWYASTSFDNYAIWWRQFTSREVKLIYGKIAREKYLVMQYGKV